MTRYPTRQSLKRTAAAAAALKFATALVIPMLDVDGNPALSPGAAYANGKSGGNGQSQWQCRNGRLGARSALTDFFQHFHSGVRFGMIDTTHHVSGQSRHYMSVGGQWIENSEARA